MDYQLLNRAIQFGKAPQSEIDGFLAAHPGGWDHDETTDGALADFLDEHGDPLAHIVRDDLHTRQLDPQKSWADNESAKAVALFGTRYPEIGETVEYHQPGGWPLAVNKLTAGDRVLYGVHWQPPTPGGHPVEYGAYLTKEQLRSVLDRFGHELHPAQE